MFVLKIWRRLNLGYFQGDWRIPINTIKAMTRILLSRSRGISGRKRAAYPTSLLAFVPILEGYDEHRAYRRCRQSLTARGTS